MISLKSFQFVGFISFAYIAVQHGVSFWPCLDSVLPEKYPVGSVGVLASFEGPILKSQDFRVGVPHGGSM